MTNLVRHAGRAQHETIQARSSNVDHQWMHAAEKRGKFRSFLLSIVRDMPTIIGQRDIYLKLLQVTIYVVSLYVCV